MKKIIDKYLQSSYLTDLELTLVRKGKFDLAKQYLEQQRRLGTDDFESDLSNWIKPLLEIGQTEEAVGIARGLRSQTYRNNGFKSIIEYFIPWDMPRARSLFAEIVDSDRIDSSLYCEFSPKLALVAMELADTAKANQLIDSSLVLSSPHIRVDYDNLIMAMLRTGRIPEINQLLPLVDTDEQQRIRGALMIHDALAIARQGNGPAAIRFMYGKIPTDVYLDYQSFIDSCEPEQLRQALPYIDSMPDFRFKRDFQLAIVGKFIRSGQFSPAIEVVQQYFGDDRADNDFFKTNAIREIIDALAKGGFFYQAMSLIKASTSDFDKLDEYVSILFADINRKDPRLLQDDQVLSP
jgi:hypothetical protein